MKKIIVTLLLIGIMTPSVTHALGIAGTASAARAAGATGAGARCSGNDYTERMEAQRAKELQDKKDKINQFCSKQHKDFISIRFCSGLLR